MLRPCRVLADAPCRLANRSVHALLAKSLWGMPASLMCTGSTYADTPAAQPLTWGLCVMPAPSGDCWPNPPSVFYDYYYHSRAIQCFPIDKGLKELPCKAT